MKTIISKVSVTLMALVMMVTMMPLLSYAETVYENVQPSPPDGFVYTIYAGEEGASVWVNGYVGSNTQVILPNSVTYNGKTYTAWDSEHNCQGNGSFALGSKTFAGNKSIVKVAVPPGYEAIDNGAFKGCTGLTEVAVSDTVGYLSNDIFDDCDNLTSFYYSGDQLGKDFGDSAVQMIINTGLGQDADGKPIAGITVYTKPGSCVEKAVEQINSNGNGNEIKVVQTEDPYSKNTVKPETTPEVTPGGKPDSKQETKGEDGTAYGKGASESVVEKAATKYASEKDPKGTTFGLLRAKLGKAKKNSLTLQFSKVKGAKKYVIYGNVCGKKNSLKRLTKTTKTKIVFKKVNKKKVTKGTYYKFMVVALDKNNKVITTSKIVHAATKGGKVGNDKAVKTKAKKDRVTVRKGKKFSLKAKPVAQSKKLKVKRHRGISYESSNTKVAAVNKKGVIRGKKKGSCYIYAYAQNGVYKKIKVVVK